MMVREGWRVPLHPLLLTLILIQCQSSARGEGMSSHFGGEGVCGEPRLCEPRLCGPYLPVILPPSLLMINQLSMVCRFLLLSYQLP